MTTPHSPRTPRVLATALLLCSIAAFVTSAAAGCRSFGEAPAAAAGGLGLDARPLNATCVAPPAAASRVRLEPAFGGATFGQPVEMEWRPDSGRVYVAGLHGHVATVDPAGGSIETAIDLALDDEVDGAWLVGFALHPTRPFAYVALDRIAEPYYSDVLRYESRDGGATFDRSTEMRVLRVERPTLYHGIGTIRFDKSGLLFVGSGDGGTNITPAMTAWDPSTLFGSILRIDVDAAEPYGIPRDNPYATGGGRAEIFAGGFRNPYKFTFDRDTNDLWAGDVGDGAFEEIDRVEKGKDYGWPALEGDACYKPREGCDRTGREAPVFAYDHAAGGSVTGGFVYRGEAIPALRGKYVFGDFVFGKIWVLERDEATGSMRADVLAGLKTKPSLVGFAEDPAGELYALDLTGGQIFALLPGDPDPVDTIPRLLSQTGCVDPGDPTKPAAGLVPYGVNVELWSDGADKERFFAIPDGTTITVGEERELVLPEGSVVMKTFTDGAGRRIETRLLRRHRGGEWSGHSYEWNDAQTEAVRVDVARDAAGVTLENGKKWALPGPGQCFACHKSVPSVPLGLELAQLNSDFSYPGDRRANQIATLTAVGLLDVDVTPETAPRLPRLDGDAPASDRARAYLHVNCSICHRPGGGVPVALDLRFDTPLSETRLCGNSWIPVPGAEGAPYITPGDATRSVAFLRAARRDGFQMPPLATRLADPRGLAVLDEWIRGLERCE